MKKIYITSIALLFGLIIVAQNQFFTPTSYRGAFAPSPAPMWTDTWANWDPQNTTYSAPTLTVTTNISSNTTWNTGATILIKGLIYVRNGAVLTIQPGVTIMGDKSIANSSLVITKGAKINAIGTVNQPIVFTSNQPANARQPGDWGGVILLGKASLNTPGDTANIEGIAPVSDSQYGGGASPNDADNSGTMSYVRIEFPGYIFAQDKEINGLTMGGVGSGTTLDHIQVSFSNDDSYEWFGGTVNARYLIAYRGLDDDFDTDFGYSGHVQFGLGVRDPSIADNPSISTSEGFESDNNASGSVATPLTSAIFSNMTLIGPYRGSLSNTIASGFRRGARIRRNSNLKIFNSIFMDHDRGIHIDGTACEANANSGGLKFKNNLVAGNAIGKVCEVNTGSTFAIRTWFAANANDSLVSTAGILINPYTFLSPDYRPQGTLATSNSNFTDNSFTGLILCSVSTPSISGSTAFCAGNNSNLSAPAGFTYLWSNSVTTQLINVTSAGTYSVTITDIYGCSASNSAVVIVNPLPSISVAGVNSICIGNNTTITASGATSYSWNTSAITNSIQVSPGSPTSYTVTGTDANSCVNSATVTVNVNTLPTVSVSGTNTICTGANTLLSANGATTYVWNTTSTNQTINVSPTSPTSYTVTGTDGNGCVNTGTVTVNVNSLPTVAISGTSTICNGENTTLTASGATNYLWNTGFTSATLNVSPTTMTSYTVTGTDVNGCVNTANTSVNVNSLPVLSSTPTIAPSNCAASTGSITNVTVTGNGTLTYDWTDAGNISVGNSATISTIPAGVYNLSVTDANSCVGMFGPYSVINPGAPATPVISINNSTVCVGQTVNLSANTTGTGNTYQWTGPGVAASTQATTIASASLTNNGTIAVTATNGGCTSAAALISLTVNALPNVGLGSSSSSVCSAGASVTLSGSPVGGTYSGTGVSGSSFFPAIAGVGSYTLTYNFTDVNGCSNSGTTAVVVNAMPIVTASAANISACVNATTDLLTGSPVGGTFSGSGVTATNFNPSLAGAGTFTLTYNYTDVNNCSGSSTTNITVNALPSLGLGVSSSSVCAQDGNVILIGVPTGGTYSGMGVTGSSFNPATAGTGTTIVTYSLTDANNCSNSTTSSIAVNACIGIETRVAFDGVNVYPNPAENVVNIYIGEMNDEVTFSVMNSIGQIVAQFKPNMDNKVDANTVQFNLTNLNSGLYFITISDNSGNKKAMRLIINK